METSIILCTCDVPVCAHAFFVESGGTSDITTQKIGQDSVVFGLGASTVLHIKCKIKF
jgi:hypothetical protein